MVKVNRILLSFFLISTTIFGPIFAESGSVNFGRTASALDASTSYFNPAGMAFLKQSEVLFGGAAFFNNKHKLYRGDLYYVQKLSPKVAIGLAINPIGHEKSNCKTFSPLTSNQIKTANTAKETGISPAFAFRIKDNLYVGFGCKLHYSYDNKVKLLSHNLDISEPFALVGAQCPSIFSIEGDFGLLYAISKKTRVGATVGVGTISHGGIESSNVHLSFDLGLYHELSKKLALLLDLGVNPGDQCYYNIGSWELEFGTRYIATNKLSLSAGLGYKKDDFRRCRIKTIAGIDYELSKSIALSCNYTFFKYKLYCCSCAHMINASLRYRW